MSDVEKTEPENAGSPRADEPAAPQDPSTTGADNSGGDGAGHRNVGPREGGELVDVPGGRDETIRTLEHRGVPDGSGNDASDPDRRPDEDEDRYDAG